MRQCDLKITNNLSKVALSLIAGFCGVLTKHHVAILDFSRYCSVRYIMERCNLWQNY